MPATTPDLKRLTVLYDTTCELCRAARAWLEEQPTYVPLSFVAAGSAMARARFPALDAAATLREITVIDDAGGVYRGAKAWLICLWATRRYRDWSLTLGVAGGDASRPPLHRLGRAQSPRSGTSRTSMEEHVVTTNASGEPTAKTSRGEETRARILSTALDLFRDRGYDETTMRAIAEHAGVSLGNAYYYFKSKEHLIQAFYGMTHAEHLAACRPILAQRDSLKTRLHDVMHAKLDTIEPYHRFSGVLFKTAADPESPLHPFSAESAPVREESTRLFREVVDGSTIKLPDDLRAELPRLLWMYHMGIVLFWIHDTSPKRRKSRQLVDLSVELIAKLVAIAGNPLMRPLRKSVLRLVEETK